jgi:hypothetical protein
MNIDMGRISVVIKEGTRSRERDFGRQNTMEAVPDKPPTARE